MRVNGRLLRPSDLAERRLFIRLGVDSLRVPRQHNPYAVARRFRRLAIMRDTDLAFFQGLVSGRRDRQPGPLHDPRTPSPDVDSPEDGAAFEHERAA